MYRLVIGLDVQEQVDALPAEAWAAFMEVLVTLELAPWNGPPQNPNNPEGAVRRWPLGLGGHVVYVILERRREVQVVLVQWVG